MKMMWLASTKLVPEAAFSRLNKMTLVLLLPALKLVSALFFLNTLPSTNAHSMPHLPSSSSISDSIGENYIRKSARNYVKQFRLVQVSFSVKSEISLFGSSYVPARRWWHVTSFGKWIICANKSPSALISCRVVRAAMAILLPRSIFGNKINQYLAGTSKLLQWEIYLIQWKSWFYVK